MNQKWLKDELERIRNLLAAGAGYEKISDRVQYILDSMGEEEEKPEFKTCGAY